MEYWKLALEYVKVLVWPLLLATLAISFRREIRLLLRDRDVQVEALGANIALTRASAEAEAALEPRADAGGDGSGAGTVVDEVPDTGSATAATTAPDTYARLAAQALEALSDDLLPVFPVERTRGDSSNENETLVRAWNQLADDAKVLCSVFPDIRQNVNPFIPLAGQTREPRWRDVGRSWNSLRWGLLKFAYVEHPYPYGASTRDTAPPAEGTVVDMYLSSQHLVRETIRTLLREAATASTARRADGS
ncbi:hypothetical protein [Streptomyces sp. bgisy034]|uniref:hypothetical protein n=1 Tax=Streptomyces sp. bgisy034 TaxID=3413774 RepID=UPI003EB7D405